MSLVPPRPKAEDKLKAFIEEPDKKVQPPEPAPPVELAITPEPEPIAALQAEQKKADKRSQYPWEATGVTPQIIKPFILRLNLPTKLKIEYIVRHSLEYRSVHDFCLQAILKQMDKDLKRLVA